MKSNLDRCHAKIFNLSLRPLQTTPAFPSLAFQPLRISARDRSLARPLAPLLHSQSLPPIIAKQAIEFASRLSPEIIAIHIEPGERRQLSLLSFQAGLSSDFNEVSGYNLQPAPAVVEKAKGRCLNAPK